MFFYFVLFYYGGPSAAFVKCEALIRINVSFVEREREVTAQKVV